MDDINNNVWNQQVGGEQNKNNEFDDNPQEQHKNSAGSQDIEDSQSPGGSFYGSSQNRHEWFAGDPQNPGDRFYNWSQNQNAGFPGGGGFNNKPKRKEKQAITLTRGKFVLLLILAMLVTAFISVGGFIIYDNVINPYSGDNNATDYKLQKSNESLSYNSIVKKTRDSVVSIETETAAYDSWIPDYVTQGAGSGVIIQSNGYIMTCNHVISGASKIRVTLRNNKKYVAKVVGADPLQDIAVLKINAKGLKAAAYGDSSKLQVGDQVMAIGNPLGQLSDTATSGIISALNRNLTIDNKKMNLLQTDATVNPGNSGGALFDASGNLIGIVVAKSSGSNVEGLGFAIPINQAAKTAKNLIKNGKPSDGKRAIIGINVQQISDEQAAAYGLSGGGIYVVEIAKKNAKKAGFKEGDKIISFDGKTVETNNDLTSLLGNRKVGDKVEVTISRDGEMKTLKVVLSEA